MTPGPFELDTDISQWAPESLRVELERALRRGPHLLITGRLGSGRTRAARLARQLLTNAGESATIVHIDPPAAGHATSAEAERPAGRCIFVGPSGLRPGAVSGANGATLITVHPWDRDDVRLTLARQGVPASVADRLHERTGGHLVFLRSWDHAGRPTDFDTAEPWQSAVDRALDVLSAEGRHLAEELACGYGVLVEPMAPTLANAVDDPTALLAELDAAALLGPGGELLPVAVAAMDRRLAPYRRQWLRRRFLSELTDPVRHQELLLRWARSGQTDPHLTRHLATCADRLSFTDPELAVSLHEAVPGTHEDHPGAQVGLAEAALVLGDHATALRAAEPAVAGDGAAGFRALRVVQDVWLDKGMPARAAKLNSRYARNDSLLEAASSFLVQIRVGDLAAAEEAWAARPAGVATTVDEIAAVALVETVRISVTSGEVDHAVLDHLAELGRDVSPECRNRTGWLPVVTALALAAGHSEAAAKLLRHQADEPDTTPEHQLLLAWAELREGRLSEAAEWQERAREVELSPRSNLLACGLDMALAQRRNDRAMIAELWPATLAAATRGEPDLFGLTAYPDLVVAAARLRETAALDTLWSRAQDLLGRLGHPPTWSNLIDWARIQAAILTTEPDHLKQPAQRLAQAAPRSTQSAVLAHAGRTWMDVLAKSFDPPEVIAAAQDLAKVGLPGDGARLSSHAAARCDDPVLRRDLLDTARLLNPSAVGPLPTHQSSRTSLQLSEREIQVASLVVRHRSYREIGETLFLSPRTVENHVARIRRRSGARSRPELLDQLRQALRDLGQLG